MYVYNVDSDEVRVAVVMPTTSWGGEGASARTSATATCTGCRTRRARRSVRPSPSRRTRPTRPRPPRRSRTAPRPVTPPRRRRMAARASRHQPPRRRRRRPFQPARRRPLSTKWSSPNRSEGGASRRAANNVKRGALGTHHPPRSAALGFGSLVYKRAKQRCNRAGDYRTVPDRRRGGRRGAARAQTSSPGSIRAHSTAKCESGWRTRLSCISAPGCGSHDATMKKPRHRSSAPMPRNARIASESRARRATRTSNHASPGYALACTCMFCTAQAVAAISTPHSGIRFDPACRLITIAIMKLTARAARAHRSRPRSWLARAHARLPHSASGAAHAVGPAHRAPVLIVVLERHHVAASRPSTRGRGRQTSISAAASRGMAPTSPPRAACPRSRARPHGRRTSEETPTGGTGRMAGAPRLEAAVGDSGKSSSSEAGRSARCATPSSRAPVAATRW